MHGKKNKNFFISMSVVVDASANETARKIHDQSRRQIEPGFNRIDQDVFIVIGVGPKAEKTKAFQYRVFGFQGGKGRIRAAARNAVEHF
jgi:hypothetical protein